MSPVSLAPLPAFRRIYPHEGEVADPPAAQTIRLLWDRVHDLEGRLQQAQTTITTLVAAHNTNEAAITQAQRSADQALALAQRPTSGGGTVVGTPGDGGDALPGGGDGGAAAEGFAASLPTGHDSGGSLTALRAGQIAGGTGNEWAALANAAPSQAVRDANQEELLLRMIWHLNTAGFQAGRQQNPSGAISVDKLTVIVDGVLRAYDMFTGGAFSDPIGLHMIEVAPPVQVADPGTPD